MVPKADVRRATVRVLVIEDEVLVRTLLAEELREAGFQVVEASHADDALACFNAGVTVDLVFSDVRMPGRLTGLDLARLLRGRYPELPIILTSGNAEPKREAGLARFIPKPYSIAYAISAVRAALNLPPDSSSEHRSN
jgi:CheY-like chemotaxis protein